MRLMTGLGLLALLLAAPATALGSGAETAIDPTEGWWRLWSVPVPQLVLTLGPAILYAVRARRLGRRLPIWRRVCFAMGVAVVLLAVSSPLDPIGEDGLFAVHMLQHALLMSLAPLLIVLGLTGPVLRPLLRVPWMRSLGALGHPVPALLLWIVALVGWHVPPVYELAIESAAVHALQHMSIFAVGALVWAAVHEPLPAPPWFGTGPKLGFLAIVWFAGLAFGNVLWFIGTPLYERYQESAPAWGVSALEDQVNAGSVFMIEHALTVLLVLAVLAFRLAREGTLRRRLLEAGFDPRAVRQAVRYGRAEALARSRGVSTEIRPGID